MGKIDQEKKSVIGLLFGLCEAAWIWQNLALLTFLRLARPAQFNIYFCHFFGPHQVYFLGKLLFFTWMGHSSFQGSSSFYNFVVCPFMKKQHSTIDSYMYGALREVEIDSRVDDTKKHR